MIAYSMEHVPDGKKRRALVYLGMKRRFSYGVVIEDHYVFDFKTKKASSISTIDFMKCEVISKI